MSVATLRRVPGFALLVCSVVPMLLLAPGMVDAPYKIWQETSAAVERLVAPAAAPQEAYLPAPEAAHRAAACCSVQRALVRATAWRAALAQAVTHSRALALAVTHSRALAQVVAYRRLLASHRPVRIAAHPAPGVAAHRAPAARVRAVARAPRRGGGHR